MKKRFLSFMLAMVLFVGTLSTSAFATTTTPTLEEVNAEVTATAQYLASITPTSSITITSYKTVTAIQLAKLPNANDYVQAFINSVIANNLSSDGKIMLSSSESLLGYCDVLLVLARSGIDASNFNGHNLIANFEACLKTYDSTTLKGMIDSNYKQYMLSDIMNTVNGYANELSDATTYKNMIKNTILSYYVSDATYGYALDLFGWGSYSADDAGIVLPVLKDFYATDNDVKVRVDASIAFVKDNINAMGTIDSVWDNNNPNSTALAIALFSAYNVPELTTVYNGLMTFKNSTTQGAYNNNSGSIDPTSTTPDAMTGLLAYSRMLSSSSIAYDIMDTSVAIYPIVIQKINALPTTITVDNKSSLDEIAKLYNSMSDAFKAKVTNYTKYETALNDYNTLIATINQPTPTNSAVKTADNSNYYLYSFTLITSVLLLIFNRKKVFN